MNDTIYNYYGTGIFSPEFIAGTEYEVEYINNHGNVGENFHIETDGSLRNNGYEYTTVPLDYINSLKAFKKLFATIDYNSAKGHSERTSTHVHINVGTLTMDQCKQLVLVYAALEPLFFNYVTSNRKDNIFCVPLSYTTMSKYYSSNFREMLEPWHKYTAFNILPVKNYGTMEFRHLQGTCHYPTYEGWLTSLKHLYEFIRDTPEFDILKYLNSGKTIEQLTNIVPILKEKVPISSLTTLLYDSTLDVKLSCGSLDK
jgi:hypothetical protein